MRLVWIECLRDAPPNTDPFLRDKPLDLMVNLTTEKEQKHLEPGFVKMRLEMKSFLIRVWIWGFC